MRLFLISFPFLCVLSVAARAQDAFVPDHFPTIQAAVLGATDLDLDGVVEIGVRAGSYHENVFVQRSNLAIVGAGAATTTITGDGIAQTFRIQNCVDVTLAGFTVQNQGTGDGVEFSRTARVFAHDLAFTQCRDGLVLNRTQDSQVLGNECKGNAGSGIRLGRGFGNRVGGNVCVANGGHGIDVAGSGGNLIKGNLVTKSQNDGIRVTDGKGNLLIGNVSTGNLQSGVRLEATIGTLVSQNTITDNQEWGLRLKQNLAADFDAAPGLQAPPGDNKVSGNVMGPVRVD